jgi:hypothetical protein
MGLPVPLTGVKDRTEGRRRNCTGEQSLGRVVSSLVVMVVSHELVISKACWSAVHCVMAHRLVTRGLLATDQQYIAHCMFAIARAGGRETAKSAIDDRSRCSRCSGTCHVHSSSSTMTPYLPFPLPKYHSPCLQPPQNHHSQKKSRRPFPVFPHTRTCMVF